jgi:hypothetical protein
VKRLVTLLCAVLGWLFLMPATQSGAITNGQPDNGAHPYVGELLFYVPDEIDPRFTDPGSWFTCSGTLLNGSIVVTAGHCTHGVGHNGASTTAHGGTGSGGNDVWINFREAPDFDILPPSSTFVPTDDNAGRYAAWKAALNASSEWHRATAYPHPRFDPDNFVSHDMGVLRLTAPVSKPAYGRLPALHLLDDVFRNDKSHHFTPVGYGLEKSGPKIALGGDTRRVADALLVNLNGVSGVGKGVAARFTNDNGAAHRGGTCFGDSGGPILMNGTRIVTAVNSFGISETCTGSTNAYRLDEPDDLAFLATFGVTP